MISTPGPRPFNTSRGQHRLFCQPKNVPHVSETSQGVVPIPLSTTEIIILIWIISFMNNFFFHLRFWLTLHQTASILRTPVDFVPWWPKVLPWLHGEIRAEARHTEMCVIWPVPTCPAASFSVSPPLIQMHRHHWPDVSPSRTPSSFSSQEAFSLSGTLFPPPSPPRGCLLL